MKKRVVILLVVEYNKIQTQPAPTQVITSLNSDPAELEKLIHGSDYKILVSIFLTPT